MVPPRNQKRQSTTSHASTPSHHPGSTRRLVSAKTPQAIQTPSKSSADRLPSLTHGQKQALIDNLQYEITERAKMLRAQYVRQAQGLQTRLEVRVGRIPTALRKTTIGELLEKHNDGPRTDRGAMARAPASPKATKASPLKVAKHPSKPTKVPSDTVQAPAVSRATKRKSDELNSDKENTSNGPDGEHPRKRQRANAPPSTNPQDPSKRILHPSQVLSPKSNNSRTLPQSPFKTGLPSPVKSNLARPVSPLKPSITAPTATSLARTAEKPTAAKVRAAAGGIRAASKTSSTTTSATTIGTTRSKRGGVAAPPPRVVEASDEAKPARVSDASEATSQGTSIVRNQTATTAPKPAAKKTGAVARAVTAANKKAAAAKAEIATGVVKGGRTLRKRA